MADTAEAVETRDARTQPGEEVLVFHDVCIRFEEKIVLQGVSFKVLGGQTRVLLGPTGTGKSVLLKIANGLIRPDSGKVLLFGQDIFQLTEDELLTLRGRVGMVFQESALFDSLDVEDNVGYRLQQEHAPPEEEHERVVEALRFVELDHTLLKYPSELSGGMRRRVAIARAIINKPDLLLYDSPTGGLDPITSTTIMDLVVKQRDFYGTSAMLVTHRLQDAFLLATHHYDAQKNAVAPNPERQLDPNTSFLVLNEGKLVFDGSTRELVHTQDEFLKEFIRD